MRIHVCRDCEWISTAAIHFSRRTMSRIILLVFIMSTVCLAQKDTTSDAGGKEKQVSPFLEVRFVPSGRLFRPLMANTFEARVGAMIVISQHQFRLDIGNSIDLLGLTINTAQGKQEFTVGADFFTYTLLRTEQGFHFPVDAIDYLFGVNLNYFRPLGSSMLGARLRVSHISAHFVDGHYDGSVAGWRDRNPQVYSREFFDLVLSYETSLVRYYVGANYLTHVDPSWLPPAAFQAGAEFTSGDYIHKNMMAYAAIDVKLISIDEYTAVKNLQFGVRLGERNGPALDLFASYFSGYSINGEYYDVKVHYWAFGFLVDF